MKKRLILIGTILVITIGLLSLYRTFSLDEEVQNNYVPSSSDILLTYSLNDGDNDIMVGSGEEKYVDINLTNIYTSSVKYGIYYVMVEPKEIVDGLIVMVDRQTKNNNEEILEPEEEKVVTIRIVNNSQYNVSLSLGSVVGFSQGDVSTLLEENMILIK